MTIPPLAFLSCWNQSQSIRQVANHFGISYRAAQGIRDRLKAKGYHFKHFTGKAIFGSIPEFLAAWESTPSLAALAEQFHCTTRQVWNRAANLRYLGYPLTRRWRKSVFGTIPSFLQRWNRAKSLVQLARHYGTTVKQVSNRGSVLRSRGHSLKRLGKNRELCTTTR